MKRKQWIVAGIVLLVVTSLYAITVKQVFGEKKHSLSKNSSPTSFTIDSILTHAKKELLPDQVNRLNFLENTASTQSNSGEKLHTFHQLSNFWRDSARIFEPYAWYTAEAARLENSEKSLTFAAHLFLNNLRTEGNPQIKEWKAFQAKDLFERSLKINPNNDSSQVGLGAVYLFGNISDAPMEGILKIRKVAEEHPDNVYAQMTLGYASITSGQLDKAIERFTKVVELQPENLEAVLALADTYERKADKENAIKWYKKTLPLSENQELIKEIENRIVELSK